MARVVGLIVVLALLNSMGTSAVEYSGAGFEQLPFAAPSRNPVPVSTADGCFVCNSDDCENGDCPYRLEFLLPELAFTLVQPPALDDTVLSDEAILTQSRLFRALRPFARLDGGYLRVNGTLAPSQALGFSAVDGSLDEADAADADIPGGYFDVDATDAAEVAYNSGYYEQESGYATEALAADDVHLDLGVGDDGDTSYPNTSYPNTSNADTNNDEVSGDVPPAPAQFALSGGGFGDDSTTGGVAVDADNADNGGDADAAGLGGNGDDSDNNNAAGDSGNGDTANDGGAPASELEPDDAPETAASDEAGSGGGDDDNADGNNAVDDSDENGAADGTDSGDSAGDGGNADSNDNEIGDADSSSNQDESPDSGGSQNDNADSGDNQGESESADGGDSVTAPNPPPNPRTHGAFPTHRLLVAGFGLIVSAVVVFYVVLVKMDD